MGCSQNESVHLSNQPQIKSHSEPVIKSQWNPMAGSRAMIRVIDENDQPIINASILIGQSVDNPFSGNLLKTNKDGIATAPTDWTNSASVTVDASKYVRQTYVDLPPGDLTVRMSLASDATLTTIQGQITELPVVNGDKLIDYALIMPAFNRSDMLNFSLDLAISPISETISVANRNVDVPTNLSLPTQTERYLLFNVTLTKPVYHLSVPFKGRKTFYAASGRFPFKPVVDGLNSDQSFYDLINEFSITGGSLRDVNLNAPVVNLDIPAAELKFTNKVNLKAPTFKNDEAVVMVAAIEATQSYIPTDIKRVSSGQSIQLNNLAEKPTYIVSALKRQSEIKSDSVGSDRLSASILQSSNYNSLMLPLVENPEIRKNSGYEVTLPQPPSLPSSLNALATTVVISDILQVDAKTKNYIRRWEIVGLNWQKKFQLPNWPLNDPQNKKRFEINFIASNIKASVRLDDDIIKSTTHISHASSEY